MPRKTYRRSYATTKRSRNSNLRLAELREICHHRCVPQLSIYYMHVNQPSWIDKSFPRKVVRFSQFSVVLLVKIKYGEILLFPSNADGARSHHSRLLHNDYCRKSSGRLCVQPPDGHVRAVRMGTVEGELRRNNSRGCVRSTAGFVLWFHRSGKTIHVNHGGYGRRKHRGTAVSALDRGKRSGKCGCRVSTLSVFVVNIIILHHYWACAISAMVTSRMIYFSQSDTYYTIRLELNFLCVNWLSC